MIRIALIAGLIGLSASTSFASRGLVNCEATEVLDSSYFEESLSVEEYPNVTLSSAGGGRTADIGAALYKEADGDRIDNGPYVGFVISYVINDGATGDSLLLTWDLSSGKGSLQVREKRDTDFRKLASLTCR